MTYMADGDETGKARDEAVNQLMAELPLRIASERLRSGLTVSAAAARAGFEPSYWGKLERGTTEPGIRNLLRVQYALGLESLEPLFGAPSGRRLSEAA
jgi:transcriptional regulator with XRE-family HTH domain